MEILKKIGLAIGGLFILVLAKGVGALIGYGASTAVSEAATTAYDHSSYGQEDKREKIETFFLTSPQFGEMGRALQKHFPEDFDALVDDLVSAPTQEAANNAAFQGMRNFRKRQLGNLAKAPDDSLVQMIINERLLIEALQRSDTSLCAQYAMTGFQQGATVPPDAVRYLSQGTAMLIEAAAKGSRSGQPARSRDLSEDDAVAMFQGMVEHGLSDEAFNAYIDGTSNSLPIREKCASGVILYRTLQDLPADEAARIYYYLATTAP